MKDVGDLKMKDLPRGCQGIYLHKDKTVRVKIGYSMIYIYKFKFDTNSVN